jgi:hypothetical protein
MPIYQGNKEILTEYVDSYGLGEIYLGTTLVQKSSDPNPFIRATGGIITTSSFYKIHTFTSASSFDILSLGSNSTNNTIDYLVVAGGGSGGQKNNAADGGGAGGFLTGSLIATSANTNQIIVGAGGIGTTNTAPNTSGSNSSALGIIALGGGKGVSSNYPDDAGKNGGSGAGNGIAISASQGKDGGVSIANSGGSGGGGASQVGQIGSTSPPLTSGNGGSGSLSSINGTATYYAAGGGAGGAQGDVNNREPGVGGFNSGGDGGSYTGDVTARSGKDATYYGGAGGGAGQFADGVKGGNGYQGIVILRYRYKEPVLWTPANISTLSWWDSSNASSVTLNSSAVSQINDLSGNGYNATQVTAANQPGYTNTLNGLNVMTFDGTNDFLNLPAINYTSQGSLSMYIVANRTGRVNNYVTNLMVWKESSNAVGLLSSFSGGAPGVRWGAYTSQDLQSTTTSSANYQVISQIIDSGSSLISWFDTGNAGGTKVGDYYNGTSAFSSGYIGNDQYNSINMGNIGEIVVINQTDNLAARQKMEGYLAWKWGLEANLPPSHLYYNEPPFA